MIDSPLKFSLIVATIGRTTQLARLFETLKLQTFQSFEVIVVDQNPLGYLDEIVDHFRGFFSIRHLRSEPGLSRARNVALDHIRGEFVAFPDDDCWYPEDLLRSVANQLAAHPDWDGVTGRLADPEDPNGFPFYHRIAGQLKFSNLWRRSTSVTIFFRRTVVDSVGRFDEDLGRGARTGMSAAEEGDYLIRAVVMGFFIFYLPELCVFHRSWQFGDETQLSLALGDGKALGYIYRKYKFPPGLVLRKLIRSIGGMVCSAILRNQGKTQYYWLTFKGILSGWLSYQQPRTDALGVSRSRFRRWISF